MPPRPRLAWFGPLLALALIVGATASGADVPRITEGPDVRIVGTPERGDLLPDSAAIAQVGDRVIRAEDFIRGWYNAWPPDLPEPDSAGRVQFLSSMVSRDFLALEAQRLGYELDFEGRMEFREYRQRMLANLLFRRGVVDSVRVSAEEVRKALPEFKYDVLARHILFFDRDLATRVRADLIARRIGWEDAVRRYTRDDSTRASGGSLGWMRRASASPLIAIEIWPLEPGAVSRVFSSADGYHVAQVMERRPCPAIDPKMALSFSQMALQQYRTTERLEVLKEQMRQNIRLSYDDENIAWAAHQFGPVAESGHGAKGAEMTYNDVVPVVSPADTARVLARHAGGVMSLGRFLELYSHVAVMARPEANSPGLLRAAVDGFVLEPAMSDEAVARGLDRHPAALRGLARKREELIVGRLYQDSVATHSWLSPKERRKFYQEHLAAYFTFPTATYASFSFRTREAADTLAAALRATPGTGNAFADSARYGWRAGSVRERRQNEGGVFQKLLFEELRPEQVAVDGPGKDGSWFVVKLLKYDGGRQLSFEEASDYVDEDTAKIRGEELLAAFVGRLKQRYPWWSRPELVMRIRLVDPES